MPRMSKKRKLEWQFFLSHRNRMTYNPLCRKCVHGCKQSFRDVVIDLPTQSVQTGEKELLMSNEKVVNINAANNAVPLPVQGGERPTLVKKIGKTTYKVTIHFSSTNRETMSDKIKRILRNEISRM